ncbi:MAG: hypothetical protein IT454_03005 [Planctomycetes bacterium]|nr:hypothetical protein [Planctomycetota bacterium]
MTRQTHRIVIAPLLTTCCALLLAAGHAPAQDVKPTNPFHAPEDDPRARMTELFKKVESRLVEIDKLLYDAGTGSGSASGVRESGIAELMQRSRSRGDEVLQGIDEILEIANQQGGGGGSCKKAMQSDKPGGQGTPKQGSKEQQAREQTPERPGGEKPLGEKEQPRSANDPQDGREPKGDREARSDPKNTPGGPPPKQSSSVVDAEKANQQWGDLPPTVRDLFRTEGGGDLPPQYRDWIDAYYRRLNRERR